MIAPSAPASPVARSAGAAAGLPLGEEVERLETRNIWLLAAYQVVVRVAWVFKTESVIVPAFLHAISGQDWVQGWLPMLNRFGQSLPPLLFADRLRDMPRKKTSLVRTTVAMGLVFGTLALLIAAFPTRAVWWPVAALVLYGLFFVAMGVNSLAFNTLQGKLVRADRRGLLMARGGVIGSIGAAAAAWVVLNGWRPGELAAFAVPFALTGIGMLAATGFAAAVAEPADEPTAARRPSKPFAEYFREAWGVFRGDRHFRRLAYCAVAFATSQFLFPHYIPLAMRRLRVDGSDLTAFLIAQNVGVGVFGIVLGRLADRFGNRMALRAALAVCSATPLVALAFVYGLLPGGTAAFWVTFFILGMQPVTFKTFTNYTLELTDPVRHPRYLSTLTICLAAPFPLSLVIGWLVGTAGHPPVFIGVATLIGLACLLTFRMSEPRRWRRAAAAEPLSDC